MQWHYNVCSLPRGVWKKPVHRLPGKSRSKLHIVGCGTVRGVEWILRDVLNASSSVELILHSTSQ